MPACIPPAVQVPGLLRSCLGDALWHAAGLFSDQTQLRCCKACGYTGRGRCGFLCWPAVSPHMNIQSGIGLQAGGDAARSVSATRTACGRTPAAAPPSQACNPSSSGCSSTWQPRLPPKRRQLQPKRSCGVKQKPGCSSGRGVVALAAKRACSQAARRAAGSGTPANTTSSGSSKAQPPRRLGDRQGGAQGCGRRQQMSPASDWRRCGRSSPRQSRWCFL